MRYRVIAKFDNETRIYEDKMTREEAIKQMKPSRWYGEDGMQGWLLDNLQALGLIKFEEVKSQELYYDIDSDITVGETNGKVYVRRGTTILWTEK